MSHGDPQVDRLHRADTITLGGVEITRIQEWAGGYGTYAELLPESTADGLESDREVLVPDFWDPPTSTYNCCIQSWLVRSEGRTILIDTGIGEDKDRQIPLFHHQHFGFLDALAASSTSPDDIDLVICTHVHVDHVGWNTRLMNDEWVPTFPNATYLFARADYEFWNPENGYQQRGAPINANMFNDSVEPVYRAGQAVLWEDDYLVDANLRIELAPGHTPGHGAIFLESGADRAVFVGDVMHSPSQISHPSWNSCFCEDPDAARKSRRRLLGWASEENALVIPAHFAGAHACEVVRAGDSFAVKEWAGWA
jgi:glyoxylase-like metal-dependent hydrolase (beta-lactamase superfamily II)